MTAKSSVVVTPMVALMITSGKVSGVRGLIAQVKDGKKTLEDVLKNNRRQFGFVTVNSIGPLLTWKDQDWEQLPTAEDWKRLVLNEGLKDLEAINNPTSMYALSAWQKIALVMAALTTNHGDAHPLKVSSLEELKSDRFVSFLPKVTILNQLCAVFKGRGFLPQSELISRQRALAMMSRVAHEAIIAKGREQNFSVLLQKLRRMEKDSTGRGRKAFSAENAAQAANKAAKNTPGKELFVSEVNKFIQNHPDMLSKVKLALHFVCVTRSARLTEANGTEIKRYRMFGELLSDDPIIEIKMDKKPILVNENGQELTWESGKFDTTLTGLAAKGVLMYDSNKISIKLGDKFGVVKGSTRVIFTLSKTIHDEMVENIRKTITPIGWGDDEVTLPQ